MTQRVRVQCFSITRDGIAAGEQQSFEHPFGHAGPGDLFGWAGGTASGVNRAAPGGSRRLDDYLTRD